MPLTVTSNLFGLFGLFGLYGHYDVLVQAMDESLYCAKRPVSIEPLRLALERLKRENIPPYPSGYYRAAIGNYLEGHPNVRRIDLFGKLQVKVFLPGYSKDELDQWLRGED